MTAPEAKEFMLKRIKGKSGSTKDMLSGEASFILGSYCDLNVELYPHNSDACTNCPVKKICNEWPDTFEELRKQLEAV